MRSSRPTLSRSSPNANVGTSSTARRVCGNKRRPRSSRRRSLSVKPSCWGRPMADAMLTPQAVVRQLTELSKELDATVTALKDAEYEMVLARHEADMVESRAFLSADGAMELRKHQSRVAADKFEEKALVSEAVVRHLRARSEEH